MSKAEVISFLEERFPPELAEEWDNTGLQVGSLEGPCRRVLVALDFQERHFSLLPGTDLILTHHPLLFRPLNKILLGKPLGEKIRQLLVSEAALYTLHTPYDAAQGGLGEVLAGLLGLREVRPLRPKGRLLKLVVFVPVDYEEVVAEAIFQAGAGKIGKYGRCSFRVRGTGTFLPEEGAKPFLGKVGEEERVDEVRLETILPAERAKEVVQAMLKAHPYEEVAYDLYPLTNQAPLHGLGRIGILPEPRPAEEVIRGFSARLGVSGPREVYGGQRQLVSRVALCGGSGGDLIPEAIAQGAELYLTGEAGYHRASEGAEEGLTTATFGHAESERPFVEHLAHLLRPAFPEVKVVEG